MGYVPGKLHSIDEREPPAEPPNQIIRDPVTPLIWIWVAAPIGWIVFEVVRWWWDA